MISNIEVEETRIFATKTKTNFALCFQLVKPEEYLMRSHTQMEDKFEKNIRMRCEKIMGLEMRGMARKKEEKKNMKLKQKIKGDLKQNRDRKSMHTLGGRREQYQSLIKQGGGLNSVVNKPMDRFSAGRLTLDKLQPLLEKDRDFDDDEEYDDEDESSLNLSRMNISQLMDYSRKKKFGKDASIFSTVMIRKDHELYDDDIDEQPVDL